MQAGFRREFRYTGITRLTRQAASKLHGVNVKERGTFRYRAAGRDQGLSVFVRVNRALREKGVAKQQPPDPGLFIITPTERRTPTTDCRQGDLPILKH